MSTHKIVIKANGGRGLGLKELLRYKDLFLLLAYRDYRVRYAQTMLGLLWAILQPIVTVGIFTFVFGYLMKIKAPNNIPYPVFALSGMVAWTYFSFVMTQAGNSVIGAQSMVQKIYFPRLVIPLSKALVGLVDFLSAFILLIILMVVYKVVPTMNMVWLPVFILAIIISSLGVGIWLSALTIRYRDFQHMVPFMVQIGLYITPVAYSSTFISGRFEFLYYINPMAGIIEGFRWCILGQDFPGNYIFISLGISLILLISGLFYFKRIESVMADIV